MENGGAVLMTTRLSMHPLTRAYLDAVTSLYADPRVTTFLKPLDEAAHLARLRETEDMWSTRGYGRVALHDRTSGRFLGRGGLHYWDQFGEVEVGWVLSADAWGHGYATEAGSAWIDWAFAELDVPYVTACIAPENVPSLAVAERLTMTPLRSDELHGRAVVVYAKYRTA